MDAREHPPRHVGAHAEGATADSDLAAIEVAQVQRSTASPFDCHGGPPGSTLPRMASPLRPPAGRIAPGSPRRLRPCETDGLEKADGLNGSRSSGQELAELENLLTYAGNHALLVVLQGRDASGKDGTIRKILEFSNILRLRPAVQGADRGRTRARLPVARARGGPAPGHVGCSTARTTRTCWRCASTTGPRAVWKRRYEHINAFERLLADEDVIVLKFFLHISNDEQ